MIDQQHVVAGLHQRPQPVAQPHRLGPVEPGGRLVQHHQRRPGHQGPPHPHQLAPALRQLGGLAVGHIAQPQQLHHLRDALGGGRAQHVVADRPPGREPPTGHVQIAAHRDVVEQLQRLPGPGQPGPGDAVGGHAGQVPAPEPHPAGGVAGQEAGDRVDEGGLARPVGADQPGQLAGAAVEAHLIHRHHPAEAHCEPLGLQHRARRPRLAAGRGSRAHRSAPTASAPAALTARTPRRLPPRSPPPGGLGGPAASV